MAWEGSTRRRRLPPDWPRIRTRILERDDHRCTHVDEHGRCPARATDVHHVHDGNDHSDGNLASLCAPHHRRETAAEAAAARAHTPPPTARRRAEQHPGMQPGA